MLIQRPKMWDGRYDVLALLRHDLDEQLENAVAKNGTGKRLGAPPCRGWVVRAGIGFPGVDRGEQAR